MGYEMAELYDAFYRAKGKDYRAESARVVELVRRLHPEARTLLDVACGTGGHLVHLQRTFRCEGVDLAEDMLAVAREKLPEMALAQADMTDFHLGRTFDAVVCLFSAIGYAVTVDRLRSALACLAEHLAPGGVLLVEPWLFPEAVSPGHVGALFLDRPDLKAARINDFLVEGRVATMHFHFLVGREGRVESHLETHVTGLFTRSEYEEAFRAAGLEPRWDEEGLSGRGLFTAVSCPQS